jgi:hypothetical protein
MARMARSTFRNRCSVAAVVATLGLTACAGDDAPTSPSPGAGQSQSDIVEFLVSCPPSLLIGQRAPCIAAARLRSGQAPLVTFDASWSSARPEVVAVDTLGLVTGRAAGQATVSASYRGQQATVIVAVTEEDALRIASGQAYQGDFTPGSTVTMWLQGYYSVASAETGRLSLRITDQNGTITTTPAVTVAKGGDFFVLSSTFVVPQNSVEVCRTAVLEVGSVTIAESPPDSPGLRCIPIRR